MKIPFVKPPVIGNERKYLLDAFDNGFHDGNGKYTELCQNFLENKFNIGKTLITTSGTDALEMTSFLINALPDDEIIMPSYTFASTATAFVSRNFKPVFCDIRVDTLNIDEEKIEALISEKTRAIVPIHYAGIPAEMDRINAIAKKYNLIVIEDAAQAVNSKYKGNYAGTLAELGAFSFHKTKAYSCGEGGAITMNNCKYYKRSEFLWEKGTDRSLVTKGLKNKYWWVDNGSSFLISDLLAAVLFAQFETLEKTHVLRKKLYEKYESLFSKYISKGLSFSNIPSHIESNYHAFWILLPNENYRDIFIDKSAAEGISVYIGYIPLHSSPMGKQVGGELYNLPITDSVYKRIIRLPFYLMSENEMDYVIDSFQKILDSMFS